MKFRAKKATNENTFIVKKIAITSVFLSLSMIFSVLSTVMPLPFLASFLNLNLSAIFLAIIMLLVNFYYCVFATFITSLLVFANPGTGQWVGVLVNFFSNFTFVSVLYLVNYLLINKTINKPTNKSTINNLGFNQKWHYTAEIIAVVATALILSTLNGLLFTPLFWFVMKWAPLSSPWFIEAMNFYNNSGNADILLMGIPNYWAGIFAIYMSFNLLNFSLCSIGISAAKIFIINSEVVKFQNKNLGGILWKVSTI